MPLFIPDPELVSMAVLGFRLYSLSMIGYSLNVTFRMYYQAMRLSLLSYVYVFCNSFLFTAAGAQLLGNTVGINGVWLAFLFGETMTLVFLLVFVLWKTDRKVRFADQFLFIPGEMTSDILGRFDGSASEIADMAEMSGQVQYFCSEKGANPRTAYLLSLAVEEFGEYILRNNSGLRQRNG